MKFITENFDLVVAITYIIQSFNMDFWSIVFLSSKPNFNNTCKDINHHFSVGSYNFASTKFSIKYWFYISQLRPGREFRLSIQILINNILTNTFNFQFSNMHGYIHCSSKTTCMIYIMFCAKHRQRLT